MCCSARDQLAVLFTSRILVRRSDRCRRDNGGFTLYEVLVSILLIGLVAGALTTGVLSALRTSATANASARASVLLTSFEETLLQLNYRECTQGDVVGLYQTDFENADDQLPEHRRIRVPGRDVEARIVKSYSGCDDGISDDGEQEIEVELTYQGRTRSGNVVKRHPDPPDRLLTAEFDVEVLTGKVVADPLRSEGELRGIFRLDPIASYSPASIEEYRWDCNAANNPAGPTGPPVVKDVDDPYECAYNATTGDQPYQIVLTIRDSRGTTATSDPVTVTVGPATQPIAPPVASIQASCPNDNCVAGDAPLDVVFKGVGNVPGSRTIDAWEWDFGDPASGSANTSNDKEPPAHRFEPSGSGTTTYTITLVVTDSNGNRSAPATHSIDVTVPGLPKPTASFTMTPGPFVLDPQTVVFDASASKDANGEDPVSSYSWDFGEGGGATGSGITDEHTYSGTGTRTVKLTVTASNGETNTTSKTLDVGAFRLPTDFRLTHSTATYNEGHIYFSWTNPPGSSADRFEYDIEIVASNVLCTSFGSKSRTVRNSVPGTFQTYDFHVDAGYLLGFIPLPAWVCPGLTYTYQLLEMRRVGLDGTELDNLGPLPGVAGPI